MNKFILKGILRDKTRSLLPIIVISMGVFVLIFLFAFIMGFSDNFMTTSANHSFGNVRVMTQAFKAEEYIKPNEYSLLESHTLLQDLKKDYPELDWAERISFGGMIDVTKDGSDVGNQIPISGSAYNFLGSGSKEFDRIELQKGIIEGSMIREKGQTLISVDFSEKFNLKPGDIISYMGSTMYGDMTFRDYKVAGIVRFGIPVLDKGSIILDLRDARDLLDMQDASTYILGFFPDSKNNTAESERIRDNFNAKYKTDTDKFAPVISTLTETGEIKEFLIRFNAVLPIFIFLIFLILTIVLWNASLISGIKRYNEFGIRIALGESKKAIYSRLIIESLFIGLIGSIIGTILGALLCLYLNVYGVDYSSTMDQLSLMTKSVVTTAFEPYIFWIGFIPGILSMILGSALAGTAIFKRDTARLFEE